MTWSIIATDTANNGNVGNIPSTIISDSINTVGSDLIVVANFGLAGGTFDVSDSMNNVWQTNIPPFSGDGTANALMYIFWCQSPKTSSTHTFVVDNGGFGSIGVIAVSGSSTNGYDQSSFFPNDNLTITEQAGAITPTQNNELIIFWDGIYNGTPGAPYSIDTGFTIQNVLDTTSASTPFGMLIATLPQTTAATVNPTLTRSQAPISQSDVSFITSFFGAAPAPPPTTTTGGRQVSEEELNQALANYSKKSYDDIQRAASIKLAASNLGKLGGNARAKALSMSQRSNIATLGANARWRNQ